MLSMYNASFQDRVDYAARVIAEKRNTSCNRAFDGCFETDDGVAVVLALWQRAQKKPNGRLAQNFLSYFCRVTFEENLRKYGHIQNVAALAEQLRDATRAEA
jgi:hypothetical protein